MSKLMLESFGHLYLAFGDYDNVAAHSAAYARQYSRLPIHVLTNLLPEERSPKWRVVEDVTFQWFGLRTEDNRMLKTSLVFHSPFDLTLYTDADSLILSPGFVEVVGLCADRDVLLPVYQRDVNVFTMRTSQRPAFETAFERYGIAKETKVTIHGGGVCVFRSSEGARRFFARWSSLYRELRVGRDMPSLALTAAGCAGTVRIGELSDDYNRGLSRVVRSFHGRWSSEHLPTYAPYHPNDADLGYHHDATK